MTAPQRDLPDHCEWWSEDTRRPCSAPVSLVLVRPGGQALRFTCAEHWPAWASRVQGWYRVLERAEWEGLARRARACSPRSSSRRISAAPIWLEPRIVGCFKNAKLVHARGSCGRP